MRTVLWSFVALTAALPLVLGTIVTATGLAGMGFLFGTDYPASSHTTLDSNIRFLGANFLGMGMVWILRNLEARLTPLRIVYATILFGGVGSATSLGMHDSPGPFATFLMGVEFAAPLLAFWLIHRVATNPSQPAQATE